MKTIIQKLSYLFILIGYVSFAQDLTITNGTSLTLVSGTDFYVNGINFNPSNNLALTGPLEFSKTATPVGESIDRVFNFSNPITNFTGEVTFYYDDSDLLPTSASESSLVLRVKDGTTWSGDLEPTRDGNLNTLIYNFPSSTSISSITASKPGILLSINKFNQLKINLFPNPVISSFKINTRCQ